MRFESKLLCLFLFCIMLTGCTMEEQAKEKPYKVVQTKTLMGTPVAITVLHHNKETATESISAAFDEIARIEGLMSTYLDESEISILNKEKRLSPSEDTLFVIKEAMKYSNLSDGAFDITVQPILNLYKYSFEELKRPPTGKEILKTLESVDYKKNQDI